MIALDPRTREPSWSASPADGRHRLRVRLVLLVTLPLALFYFAWLVQPERVGHPLLYGLLLAAEAFNLVQALGFWWTCAGERSRRPLGMPAPDGRVPQVDVLIPVYDEPVEVVELTVAAAAQMRGARVHVHLLDDGGSDDMRALAARMRAGYVRRRGNEGAKAGNINNALLRTSAPYVLVLDCDHVPTADFLECTLGHLADERVAFVQTPQYYANCDSGDIPGAAWSQQSLFFGAISRGKDGHGAMFCCGTNVLFRRSALQEAGGFPEGSLTEDFELSVRLHERGWRSAYVPRVLARGLGPEDMSSYVSQQQRWARGCLSALPAVLRSRLPCRMRMQYLLSAAFFLSGWTLLVYMTFPVVRIFTGAQPLAGTSADQFVLHFAPYFGFALVTVAMLGSGSYTFRAYALQAASFWIHVQASLFALLRRRGRFVVTPKQGARERQPRAVLPGLAAVTVLLATIAYGVARGPDPATMNNMAFALLHVIVLVTGIAPALRVTAAADEAAPAREAPEIREERLAA